MGAATSGTDKAPGLAWHGAVMFVMAVYARR